MNNSAPTLTSSQEGVAGVIRVALAKVNKKPVWLAARLEKTESWVSRRMTGQIRFDTEDMDLVAEAFGAVDFFELMSSDFMANLTPASLTVDELAAAS